MQEKIFKEALASLIDTLEVTGAVTLYLEGWNTIEYKFLELCFTHEIVSIRELREMLHCRLKAIGRRCYVWVVDETAPTVRHPDTCPCPSVLAYALYRGEFSDDEALHLREQYGELSQFYEQSGRRLLDDIIRQLIQMMN